jgi:hypothetical protein
MNYYGIVHRLLMFFKARYRILHAASSDGSIARFLMIFRNVIYLQAQQHKFETLSPIGKYRFYAHVYCTINILSVTEFWRKKRKSIKVN